MLHVGMLDTAILQCFSGGKRQDRFDRLWSSRIGNLDSLHDCHMVCHVWSWSHRDRERIGPLKKHQVRLFCQVEGGVIVRCQSVLLQYSVDQRRQPAELGKAFTHVRRQVKRNCAAILSINCRSRNRKPWLNVAEGLPRAGSVKPAMESDKC